jgi:hypothetical protein
VFSSSSNKVIRCGTNLVLYQLELKRWASVLSSLSVSLRLFQVSSRVGQVPGVRRILFRRNTMTSISFYVAVQCVFAILYALDQTFVERDRALVVAKK